MKRLLVLLTDCLDTLMKPFSVRKMLKIAATFLTICLLVCTTPCPGFALFGSESSYSSLSEMADAMAKEVKGKYAGKKLYIKPDHITNTANGAMLPLSAILARELERSLSASGFVFEVFLSDRIDYEIHATYRPSGESLRVNVTLSDIKKDGAYRNLEKTYDIALKSLPEGWDRENLDDRIASLAQRVIGNSKSKIIYLNPIVENRKKYTSEFGEYVLIRLKSILSDSDIKLVELVNSPKQPPPTSKSAVLTLETSDAARAGANAMLNGGFLRQGDKGILVSLTLKDMNGKVLGSADDTIPRALVTYSLDNDDAGKMSEFADIEHEQSGNMIKIGTSKGSEYQVYREGEIVSFTIQVARPLYIYVYDINPKGEVSLIYPKAGDPEITKKPGVIYTLPEAADSWEIKVEAPYGKDVVKVFATDRRLPIPRISESVASRSFEGNTRALPRREKIQNELTTQAVINGRDLVDYYKGLAEKNGTPLFESSVFVETRAK